MEETERAMQLQMELSELINKRLDVALHTPNSALSSAEALEILDGLNIIDSVSLVGRAIGRHSLGYEIDALEQVEMDYFSGLDELGQADRGLKKADRDKALALKRTEQAEKAQLAALKALEAAQAKLVESKQLLSQSTRQHGEAESKFAKATATVEKATVHLEKRQEREKRNNAKPLTPNATAVRTTTSQATHPAAPAATAAAREVRATFRV